MNKYLNVNRTTSRTGRYWVLVAGLVVATIAPVLLINNQQHNLFLGFLAIFTLAWVGQRVFLMFSAEPRERKLLRQHYWHAFVIILVITCLFYNLLLIAEWKGRPGFYYDDEPAYDKRGQVTAECWHAGLSLPLEVTRSNNFVQVNGAIYYLFGHHPILIRLLNALAGLWIAVSVASIARTVFSFEQKASKYVFWLIAVNPIILIWSLSHLRDIQVAVGSAITFWALVKLLEQRKLGIIVVGGAALAWVWYVRPLSAGFLVTSIAIGLILRELVCHLGRRAKQRPGSATLWTVVIVLAITWSYSTWIPILSEEWDQNAGSGQLVWEETDAAFSDSLSMGTKVTPFNFAIVMARSLLIPNPYTIATAPDFYKVVQFSAGLPWYLLLPFWLTGWVALLKRGSPLLWPVHTFVLGMLLLSSYAAFSAYRNPLRIRVPALAFLMLFAVYGIHLFRHTRKYMLRGLVTLIYCFELGLGIHYFLSKAIPWSVFSLQGVLAYVLIGGGSAILAFVAGCLGRRRAVWHGVKVK